MNKLVIAGLMLLLLTCSLGCSVDCRYDLSSTPPFSAYVGKSVTLTRPMLLVETRDPGPPESSVVLDTGKQDAIRFGHRKTGRDSIWAEIGQCD